MGRGGGEGRRSEAGPQPLSADKQAAWDAVGDAVRDLAQALVTAGDSEGAEAALRQMRQVSSRLDPKEILNALHVPADAGEHQPVLHRMLLRIPDGWGRWIGCGRGWYPLLVETERRLAALLPDYKIHQVKEKYGELCFYWAPGSAPYELVDAQPPFPRVPEGEESEAEHEERLERYNRDYEAWRERREAWERTTEGKTVLAEWKRRCDEADRVVEEVERRAAEICEACGEPGAVTVRGGWYQTLCQEHAAEADAELVRGGIFLYDELKERGLISSADAEQLLEHVADRDPEERAAQVALELPSPERRRCKELGEEFVAGLLRGVSGRRWRLGETWGERDLTVRLKIGGSDEEERLAQDVAERLGMADLLADD